MKTFNVDLNLHVQTGTETAKYRRQSIVVHRKTQVSKGKVIGNKVWTNPVVTILIYQRDNQTEYTVTVKVQLHAF